MHLSFSVSTSVLRVRAAPTGTIGKPDHLRPLSDARTDFVGQDLQLKVTVMGLGHLLLLFSVKNDSLLLYYCNSGGPWVPGSD